MSTDLYHFAVGLIATIASGVVAGRFAGQRDTASASLRDFATALALVSLVVWSMQRGESQPLAVAWVLNGLAALSFGIHDFIVHDWEQ